MEDLKKFYNYFDLEISAFSGTKRAKFTESIKNDLKPCKVVSVYELFNKSQIDVMKRIVKQKECFRNAFQIADTIWHPDGCIKYVEGRVLVADFLPIEHAWNRIGDKYFDATFELALGKNVDDESYCLLAEYDLNKVREIILERKYWGEIYRDEKFKEFCHDNKK